MRPQVRSMEDDAIFLMFLQAKKIIELERKNDKQFKEAFKALDSLVKETRQADEKVMGFIQGTSNNR